MKKCNRCGDSKPLNKFNKSRKHYRGYCKSCENLKRKNNLYKVNTEMYHTDKCMICGTEDPGRNCESFCIDHCHDTGQIRGLLCHSCNIGLGNFKDSIETLEKAIKYLNVDSFSDI